MEENMIKVKGYDLPIQELALGSGVKKVLTSAPAPAPGVPSVCADRSSQDVLSVCVYGLGARSGDRFAPPQISYEALYRLFDRAPVHTYSAKNAWFGYRSEIGRFLPLEDVINALYGDGVYSMEAMVAERPDATVTVSSGGKVTRLLASQLMNGHRFYYPLLTSEQILSGMKPEESRGEQLDVGLLRTGNTPSDFRVIFVIGQRNWNDMTESSFVDFADGGASIAVEYLPQSRTKHNILYVGPLGGEIGSSIIAYPGKGSTVTELSAPAGSLIRFNIDNNDFLNNAHMYYKFTMDDEACSVPCPEDGFVYNTRIPLYFGNGVDYPSGIILPVDGTHRAINIKMLAHSDAFADSEIDCFRINII